MRSFPKTPADGVGRRLARAGAPAAIGPYSQAIKVNGWLFVSGSLGFDPATMTIVEGGIEAQTEQALKNLQAIVEDGGSSVGQVVKTTVRRSPRFLVCLTRLTVPAGYSCF